MTEKKSSPLSIQLAAAVAEINKLKARIATLLARPLAPTPKPRPQLPPSLRAQHDALTTPAERQAFLKKHWRALHDSNQYKI
jgi:hypothetical protein